MKTITVLTVLQVPDDIAGLPADARLDAVVDALCGIGRLHADVRFASVEDGVTDAARAAGAEDA